MTMLEFSHLARPSAWDLGNEVLYALCADYPDHQDPEVVLAKLWLIGRAGSAPLEQGRKTRGKRKTEDFYTGRAVPMVMAEPVDSWLAELEGTHLDWEHLPVILEVHGRLLTLFREVSGRAQRALTSKYLHFHRPDLFFLYDSRTAAAVRSEVSRPPTVPTSPGIDREYALFARRCLRLIEKHGSDAPVELTPRTLDRAILGY